MSVFPFMLPWLDEIAIEMEGLFGFKPSRNQTVNMVVYVMRKKLDFRENSTAKIIKRRIMSFRPWSDKKAKLLLDTPNKDWLKKRGNLFQVAPNILCAALVRHYLKVLKYGID